MYTPICFGMFWDHHVKVALDSCGASCHQHSVQRFNILKDVFMWKLKKPQVTRFAIWKHQFWGETWIFVLGLRSSAWVQKRFQPQPVFNILDRAVIVRSQCQMWYTYTRCFQIEQVEMGFSIYMPRTTYSIASSLHFETLWRVIYDMSIPWFQVSRLQ